MFLSIPDFNIDTVHGKPTDTIRKALMVLANGKFPLHATGVNQNYMNDEKLKSSSDDSSVSTAPSSSVSSTYSVHEESDIENYHENEVTIPSLPPDALFIVQGKEFPCHMQLLLKEARPLYDIISRDGSLERKTKKQRSLSSKEDQRTDQSQEWSSKSGITVVRLPEDVDSDYFEVLMEFLYGKEIRLKLPEGYQEDSEEVDPWLMDEEDIFDDGETDDENDLHFIEISSSQDTERTTTAAATPLKFLQRTFSIADRFGCTSLKTAIENKIYDEFLFSFTAKELFNWAQENQCTYLKEKAMEKLRKPFSNENGKKFSS